MGLWKEASSGWKGRHMAVYLKSQVVHVHGLLGGSDNWLGVGSWACFTLNLGFIL